MVHRHIIAALLALVAASAAWAAVGPDQLAKQIVEATQQANNATFVRENFAKDLVAKLYAPGQTDEADGIDFDIFTYSQDPDYEHIRKTVTSQVKQDGDSSAVVQVTFTQGGEKVSVDYRLKKSGERWLIDEVVYPSDGYSLREGLGLK